jgi:hypothetical protein|tara:strand:- start:665 stop:982 length:318 start_codon:yes stop_codon:yes gene_type:complete
MKRSLLESMGQLSAYEGIVAEDEKMPSKAHITKMCKDGKSTAEICKMHPDCDQAELKAMIKDCADDTAVKESDKSIGDINADADMTEAQKIRAMGDKLAAIFGTA